MNQALSNPPIDIKKVERRVPVLRLHSQVVDKVLLHSRPKIFTRIAQTYNGLINCNILPLKIQNISQSEFFA